MLPPPHVSKVRFVRQRAVLEAERRVRQRVVNGIAHCSCPMYRLRRCLPAFTLAPAQACLPPAGSAPHTTPLYSVWSLSHPVRLA